ncbi:MAG: hypothetical protein PVH03_13595 [Chloroflexota bacterium]|jgi:hypothetical protein
MGFERFNLNSPARQALWGQNRGDIEKLLERVKEEVFDGDASIKEDYVSRFSGLAKPNLALGPTTDLRGFIGICISPKQEDMLRVLASNGHTASRNDIRPDELEDAIEKALDRWLSQPMYRPG